MACRCVSIVDDYMLPLRDEFYLAVGLSSSVEI